MNAGAISRFFAFGLMVGFYVLASPRDGGAQVGDCCPICPNLVPTCTATVQIPLLDNGAYGYDNNHNLTYNINWHVNWSCNNGQKSACGLCAQSMWWSGPMDGFGPWTSLNSGYPLGNIQPRSGSCNTNYTTSFITTFTGLAANTLFRVELYAAPMNSSNQCPSNPDDYTSSTTFYFNGNGT
jgi:hypothetical protein